jgi:antitoxin component YwqK of YwqJK toxin-antitoxin module
MRLFILIGFILINTFHLTAQYKEIANFNLKSLYGKTFKTSYLITEENPVLIVTWSKYTCSPCIKMLNRLKEQIPLLEQKYGLRFIAVNVDDPKNFTSEETQIAFMKNFVDSLGWTFENYIDIDQYFVKNYTQTNPFFLFLKNGKMLSYFISYKTTHENIEIALNYLNTNERYFNDNGLPSLEEDAYTKHLLNQINDSIWSLKIFEDEKLVKEMDVKYYFPHLVNGSYKEYYKQGVLKKDYQFHNGILNGKATDWTENSKPLIEGNYKNGKLDGFINYYWANNGMIKQKLEVKDGILINVLLLNDINGNDLQIGDFKNANGWLYSYYDNGTIKQKELYNNGKLVELITYTSKGEFIARSYIINDNYDTEKQTEVIYEQLKKALKHNDFSLLDSSIFRITFYSEAYFNDSSTIAKVETKKLKLFNQFSQINKIAIQKYGIFLKNATFENYKSMIDNQNITKSYFEFSIVGEDQSNFKVNVKLNYMKEGKFYIEKIEIID